MIGAGLQVLKDGAGRLVGKDNILPAILNGSEIMIGKGNVEGYSKVGRKLDKIETFVEVHIEQGKCLEKENLPCGIVRGIVGPCWLEFTFHGEVITGIRMYHF